MRGTGLSVVVLLALTLGLGACGTETVLTNSPVADDGVASAEPTGDPDSDVDDWRFDPDEPAATVLPTRMCIETHEPWEEPGEETLWLWVDEECFYGTLETGTPECSEEDENGVQFCTQYLGLRQREVDEWNAHADAQDSSQAQMMGLTLEDYRARYPDPSVP